MKEIDIYLPYNRRPIKTRDQLVKEQREAEEESVRKRNRILSWLIALALEGFGIVSIVIYKGDLTPLIFCSLMSLVAVYGKGDDLK